MTNTRQTDRNLSAFTDERTEYAVRVLDACLNNLPIPAPTGIIAAQSS